MSRENCAFPKCSTSRKDKGISLLKVPTPDKTNNESIKWTKDITDITLKYRLKDESLIRRIQSHKLHICDTLYSRSNIYLSNT